MSHVAYVNGRYLPHKGAMVHIEDRGYQFADGIYEVIYIWNGKPVDYGAHLRRLNRSLGEIRIAPPCSDAALTAVIRETLRRNRLARGIVYIQVNRGVAPRNHAFPAKAVRPSLVITVRHMPPPPENLAEQGVKVVPVPDIRWGRRDIKAIGLLPNALAKQAAAEAKAFEALLHAPDGTVYEASASNAWMVAPDKTIVTHPADNHILGGVTRATVIRLAREAGYKVAERPFTLDEAYKAKEVFLSGTTTFVMPVVAIGETPVANGAPGTVALELRRLYRAHLDSLTESAWRE